jgi:dsDNA-specific endonuclease/ATPase MutS2
MGGKDPEEGAEDDIHVVPIEDSIDLHFFAPRDILSVVDEYLREAQRLGLTEVRLIHGRGKGVQRSRVQDLLTRHPAVVRFGSDGLGSTVVELAPSKRQPGVKRDQ